MPTLRRVRSQSTSNPSGPHLFSGFQQWRRRRPSASLPSSPSSPQSNSGTAATALVAPFSDDDQLPNACPPDEMAPSSSTNDTQQAPGTDRAIPVPPNSSSAPTAAASLSSPVSSASATDRGVPVRLVPNLGMNARCFVFDVIDRTLLPGQKVKIGRYSERHINNDRLSFKSKVVSRTHAELWVDENRKVFLQDVGSSSGTFINHVRQSPSNTASGPVELRDGDLIQLGVDYQGGWEQMYRAVKMRVEINRQRQPSQSFHRQAFQNLRQHLLGSTPPAQSSPLQGDDMDAMSPETPRQPQLQNDHLAAAIGASPSPGTTMNTLASTKSDGAAAATLDTLRAAAKNDPNNASSSHLPMQAPTASATDIQECCICLYAIAPLQALFVAPCSHVYHFKCLRPIIFQHYPAFSCPICRSYFDLEASVAVEVSEVAEAMGFNTAPSANAPSNDIHPSEMSNNAAATATTAEAEAATSSTDAMHTDDHPLSSPSVSSSENGDDDADVDERDVDEHMSAAPSAQPDATHDAGAGGVSSTAQPTNTKRSTTPHNLHIRTSSNLDASLLSTTLVETPTLVDQAGMPPSSNLGSS
ncbi:hypothetical protein BC940DRAFT_367859 [Gongronella butleri]|nr:hypothetical protein BC940DRAFT_367859 [Gongronella butleri]